MAFADKDDVQRLQDLLEGAEDVVIFTGAGISTESGIPDFRSPGGLWTKYKPIDFSDFMASEEMRRESWRRKFAMDRTMATAEPNRGHRAVARLVDTGKVSAVITQNVDGLHQASGIPDMQVIELHGNATYAKCLGCGLRHELDPIKEAFLADETMPICAGCGSEFMKTATISFGQSMPEAEMARAQELEMTRHEVVILASLVEKETAAPAERPQIASVFHNRLRIGMKLECDPTIVYGIENYDGVIHKSDIRNPHPWNTYVHPGLPKGPIANPGGEAIQAVLHPDETRYLYFVSRNDGTHHFSTSYAEHNRMVQKHQR